MGFLALFVHLQKPVLVVFAFPRGITEAFLNAQPNTAEEC